MDDDADDDLNVYDDDIDVDGDMDVDDNYIKVEGRSPQICTVCNSVTSKNQK